ncbi:MAG: hypothetical protein ABIQ59_13355 [Nocardioidaceae bacterium]
MTSAERARNKALQEATDARALDVDVRLTDALRYLNKRALPINVSSVARQAEVSRQSIYARKDLCSEVQAIARQNHANQPSGPASGRASDGSLRAKNTVLLNENRRLKKELARAQQQVGDLIAERRLGAPVTPLRSRSA